MFTRTWFCLDQCDSIRIRIRILPHWSVNPATFTFRHQKNLVRFLWLNFFRWQRWFDTYPLSIDRLLVTTIMCMGLMCLLNGILFSIYYQLAKLEKNMTIKIAVLLYLPIPPMPPQHTSKGRHKPLAFIRLVICTNQLWRNLHTHACAEINYAGQAIIRHSCETVNPSPEKH